MKQLTGDIFSWLHNTFFKSVVHADCSLFKIFKQPARVVDNVNFEDAFHTEPQVDVLG